MSQLGGAENHLLSLIGEQAQRGHEVDFAWLKGDGEIVDRFRQAGARRTFKAAFEHVWQAPAAMATLRRRMSEARYDIVHTHLMKSNAIGGIAARLSGACPAVIATKHCDDTYLKTPPMGWIHGLMSRLLDDHVICISDHVRDFLEQYGHVPKTRSRRVYYGFDRSLYPAAGGSDVRAEFGLPRTAFLFGIVGRLTEQKNHLFLLPAFAEVARKQPEAHLLVIGGEGYSPDYRIQVEEMIDRLDIGDRTILTGWRSDAYQIMAGLDCMVLPSLWEGLGVVFLEAVGLGVPVIALRTSAVPEVVRDGIDGILVEPGDSEGLRGAMTQMIEAHGGILSRVQAEGPVHIDRKFAVENMVEQTFEIYQQVLERRDTAPVRG